MVQLPAGACHVPASHSRLTANTTATSRVGCTRLWVLEPASGLALHRKHGPGRLTAGWCVRSSLRRPTTGTQPAATDRGTSRRQRYDVAAGSQARE